jgi:hypothetical protein
MSQPVTETFAYTDLAGVTYEVTTSPGKIESLRPIACPGHRPVTFAAVMRKPHWWSRSSVEVAPAFTRCELCWESL